MTLLISAKRSKMILGFFWALLFTTNSQAQIDLSRPWETESDLSYFDLATLDSLIDNSLADLEFTDGVIVIHRGKIVAERYFNESSAAETYNIWSVTKSFTATLVGQAVDKSLIAGPDDTLDSFFPNHSEDYLSLVTLGELLSMSSGYLDAYSYPAWALVSTQDLIGMGHDEAPGSFRYNSSACNMLSHILYEGTGLTPLDFASLHLFPYLGIDNPAWLAGFNDINDGSASLELTLREMVKLGQLYLQNGMSGETAVVSADWVSAATSPQATSYSGYGYLWWLKDNSYSAIGVGGQHVIVVPGYELVIGIHSRLGCPNSYYGQLTDVLYDEIVPLFNLPASAVSQKLPLALAGPTVFPNPFNPSTQIGFRLASASQVSLKIYDVGGDLVRVLVDGVALNSGEQMFTWDGRGEGGKVLASGVYLSRLDVEGVSYTSRMLLLK
jgi:CubicO group peptidase (beta-lactamase class C family)